MKQPKRKKKYTILDELNSMKPKTKPRKKKIEKLEIDLFEDSTRVEYNNARLKFIADYSTYTLGGFFSLGHFIPDPIRGEAVWNQKYPGGYDSWSNDNRFLTARGEQDVINKINELVDEVNKLKGLR